MTRPLIALLNAPIYIVFLMFTDSGHLRTTLVVTPIAASRPAEPFKLAIGSECRGERARDLRVHPITERQSLMAVEKGLEDEDMSVAISVEK